MLLGGNGVHYGAYGESYVVSTTDCDDYAINPPGQSNTSDWAGEMWLSGGVLYASEDRAGNGNYTGVLRSDGTFELATPPVDSNGVRDTVDGRLAVKSGADVATMTGRWSDVYSGPCVENYIINILVRHLTGDPPEMAARATDYLRDETDLLLPDLVGAETIYVLESFYEAPRDQIADSMRSLLPSVDEALLLRAIEISETEGLDFAEAYLVACAESTGVNVASFDRSIDRISSVIRVEPGR